MTDFSLGSLVMEDSGTDGRCIVMLHGLGGSSTTFEPLMPALSSYRVLRPDYPGSGRSGYQPSVTTIAQLSRAVTNVLVAARVRRATLVAHSLGTLLAQHMAVSAPERVDALVLFGAMTEPPTTARQALQARADLALKEGMVPIADAVASASLSNHTRTSNPAAYAFVRESVLRQEPRAYASHCLALAKATAFKPMDIRCPVSLITGKDDPVTPPSMATSLHSNLMTSSLTLLDSVGHWPTIEAPGESSRCLLQALQDQEQPIMKDQRSQYDG